MMKKLKVIGPAYYGAPAPKYDPCCINESRLPKPMRFREYDMTVSGNDLTLNWETQEPWTDTQFDRFVTEIVESFRRNGCDGKLHLNLSDRDGIKKPVPLTLAI